MKKIYIKITLIVILIAIITSLPLKILIEELYLHKEKEYIVSVKTDSGTLKLDIEDYLVGVLSGEMPANFEIEALKAQAVASRTYVLSRNLKVDATTSTQVYLTDEQMKTKWGGQYEFYKAKVTEAVQETRGIAMKYNNKYISALFFASSCGKTAGSGEYFTGTQPYLVAVESSWEKETDPKFKRTSEFTFKELRSLLNVSGSINMVVKSYTDSGYVKEVSLNNKTITGRELREKLGLASSSFDLVKTSTGYKITTYGYGHGVGMSQYGAQGMALEDYDYLDILNYYYKNIDIIGIY